MIILNNITSILTAWCVLFTDIVQIDNVDSVVETAIRELKNNKRKSRTPTKTSTLIITGVHRMVSHNHRGS